MGRARRRSWIRRVRHRIVFWVAQLLFGTLSALPFMLAWRLGRWVGTMGYYLAGANRKRALAQLEMALGDSMTPPQRRQAIRRLFGNLGCIAAEMAQVPRLDANFIRRHVRVIGKEHFDTAREEIKKHGLIAITAHLGAWEWIPQYGALMEDVEVIAVARELSNPLMQTWTERLREHHGVRVAYRKKAGVATLRALKRGGGVGILADQCIKGEGIFAPFFGRPAHTLTGPARLALKTGAVVLPMFMIRDTKPPYWTLHILEPLEIPAEENSELQAYRLTAAFTSTIEKAVRQWPDQWVWFHKRWHRTPETDDDPIFDPLAGTISRRSPSPTATKPIHSPNKESGS